MRVRYFAWVRERTGLAEEEVQLPAEVRTIAELVAHLKTRGPEFENAFADARAVRAAIDQRHVAPDAPLGDAREVAFFPPMTGG